MVSYDSTLPDLCEESMGTHCNIAYLCIQYNMCDVSPQCGPQDTVCDPEAGNKGLHTSLLERLHNMYMHQGKSLCDEYTASLSTNYRCDPGKIIVCIDHLRLLYICFVHM